MSSFTKLIFSLLILISFGLHASQTQSTLSANTKNLFSQQENEWLDAHKTLTVGLTEGWPPMSSSNDKSQPQGIDVDIIQLLNSRLGNRLNIEIDEWSRIYTRIKEKKIDLVMGIVALKSREPFLNFTSPYMDIPLVIVARKNSTDFFKTEKNLTGKVIALERGYSTIDHFQNNYPDVKIKLYDTSLEALEAVSRGDTDAYAGSRITTLHLIEKNLLSNLKTHGRLSIKAPSLSIGVRKDYPVLTSIMQKALLDIGSLPIREIINKRLLSDKPVFNKNINLTPQEQAWLFDNPVLQVGIMSGWPPFNFVDNKGNPKGIGVDIIHEMNHYLDNRLNIMPGEWKDIYDSVKQKKLDLLLDITPKKSREPFFNFTTPYMDVPHIIFARNDTDFISSEAALSGKILALEKGFGNVKYFKEKYPDIKLKLYANTTEALEAVSRGEALAYAGNRVVALYIIEKQALVNLTAHGRLTKSGSILAIGTRKDYSILRDIIQKILDDIGEGELRDIKNRWIFTPFPAATKTSSQLILTEQEKTWLKTHPEITLGVDSSWEPLEYIDQQGKYQGLSSAYMDYFSQQLGITFKSPEKMPWDQVIQGLQDKTIDIAPLVAKTEKRTQYLNFTKPYQQFPLVLFNRRGQTLLRGLIDLQGKKLGVVKGYAVAELISNDYPEQEQVYFLNAKEGLEALSIGKIDAYIDVLAVGGYLMASGGLSNLQVASSTPYNYQFSIGIRKDWPELTGILNKAIALIPTEKKNQFLKNWLVLPSAQKVDYTLLIWVLVIALVIFSMFVLRAREMARVNARLTESRERLSLSLESADLGTWEITFHKNNEPTYKWNETFARQHNLPTNKLIHQLDEFYAYLSPEYIEEARSALNKYISGKSKIFKIEYLTGYNRRWISSQGRIFERDAKGWASRIVGISQDITERKEANLAIERSSKFKSQFLANMSHEIRTPMNAIVGLGHLLLQTDLNEKQSDYINNLQKSSQTLLALIDDILDLSKIEAGHLNIENIEFSLEQLLNDLANLSVIRITKKIEFIYDMGVRVPDMLTGDPFRINQVLTNLITNSIKFTQSGNIILRVSVLDKQERAKDKTWLQFEVSDTGIGIAANKLDKLFEPFVQEDGSTTRKYGGTGLGLSISKQLIELMGGEIAATSTQGKGSKFYFKLPFSILKTYDTKPLLGSPSPDLRGLRILLIDDNHLSLKILSQMLESMSFSVTSVSSGKKALQLLNDRYDKNFDVVLLDWRMPGMDGEKTSRQIRQQIPKEKLPIIILMTAYGREAAEQKIDHMSIDGFLVKPITPSQLFNAIIQARTGIPQQVRKNTNAITQHQVTITPLEGHVLLAEDNVINQQVAREILQQMGLQVRICESGVEVLAVLKKFQPDLILMDIQMPDMDGYEATKIIRENPSYSELPIIAMTANAMVEDKARSIKMGMNGHISKPVDPHLLYETLCQYLPLQNIDQQQAEQLPEKQHSLDDAQTWPDSVPGLNIKQGIKLVGGNETLYQKLLYDFVQNHHLLVDNLKQALLDGNHEKAKRLIHTIKGVSGNIGANRLMKVATVIDKLFKHNVNVSVSDKVLSSLAEISEELFNSLKPLVESHQVSNRIINQQESKVINPDDLKQIKTALQTGDSESIKIIQKLSPSLVSLLGKKSVNTLIDFIKDYEFEKAYELLLTLLEEKNNV